MCPICVTIMNILHMHSDNVSILLILCKFQCIKRRADSGFNEKFLFILNLFLDTNRQLEID